MNNKQTAVEWLIQEFEKKYPYLMEDGMINQAKTIEREQIIDAYIVASPKLEDITKEAAEQYYNENYGN